MYKNYLDFNELNTEAVRLELAVSHLTPVFKTDTLNDSATLPKF